jgi:hypothetical protein
MPLWLLLLRLWGFATIVLRTTKDRTDLSVWRCTQLPGCSGTTEEDGRTARYPVPTIVVSPCRRQRQITVDDSERDGVTCPPTYAAHASRSLLLASLILAFCAPVARFASVPAAL